MAKFSRAELSQMLMIGFSGPILPESYAKWLKEGLGGVVLFSRNIESPEQLAALTTAIQKAAEKNPSSLPTLIGADQEGGRVFRLKPPFTLFPAARNVFKSMRGKTTGTLAYESAKAMARELSAMGIRLDFAPVLDVDSNPQNPIIGDRAFADNPEAVITAGLEIIRGLRDEGVLHCGKHFPGHGDTAQDSHLELPYVNAPQERLQNIELRPFAQLIAQGELEMIMTAHVLYPALDADWPATLSEKILTQILGRQLGFKGVVISDDLEMKAIKDRYPWSDIVERAVNAGVDILLVCHQEELQKEILELLSELIAQGKIPEARIRQALSRIETVKKRYLKKPFPLLKSEWQTIVGCAQHQELAAEISRYA